MVVLAIISALPQPACADVYGYRDRQGKLHITTSRPRGDHDVLLKTRIRQRSFKGVNYAARMTAPPADDALSREIMAHWADERDLPPALVWAIIRTESNFDPNAVSPKGAKGLMQLMPGVIQAYGVTDPFDPDQNVRAGTAYFRQMMTAFKDLNLALAAYNAGPGAVQTYNGVPPYKETKNYVNKIMGMLGGS